MSDSSKLLRVENYIIEGCRVLDPDLHGILEQSEILQFASEGKFEKVLTSSIAKELLCRNDHKREKIVHIIEENGQRLLDQCDNVDIRQLELLAVGISCLQAFIQNNWMGPLTHLVIKDILPEAFTESDKHSTLLDGIYSELSCDGVTAYHLCINIEFLYLARCILFHCQQYLTNLQTTEWWQIHCLNVHQQLLDEKSPSLKEKVFELIDIVSKKEPWKTCHNKRNLAVQFHLEAGYLCFTYYEYKRAKQHFDTVKELSQFQVELTGVMGKRTRFQQDDKAQLVLTVKRAMTTEDDVKDKYKTELPKMVQLDDDTVLDEVQYSDPSQEHTIDLTALDQAVIIGLMEYLLRSRASQEELTQEEAMAYIDCVLSQAKSWAVSVSALVKRSSLQKGKRRTVERSMMQLEEIVSQITREDPSADHRLYLFYCVRINPVWNIQKQLSELLLSLGAIGNALEVFERLQLWEDVIQCYKRLGKMEKAESLIREQLEIKETANLWCFLGDVTRDLSHYEKALELSDNRHVRAHRCLGYLYLNEEKYERSIECFEKSLKINTLQIPVWFTLGCACLAAMQYEKAAHAFKRCVNIDTDNFEAWNNLALAYIRLNEKPKAFLTLKESIKCNYDSWKIWENLLIVSTDCGEFEESINAYHRLIDLRSKWIDEKVLEILVKGVTGQYTDAQGLPANRHQQKLMQLFGRVTAQVTTNGRIWNLYAQLTNAIEEKTPESSQKVLQYLQKSHRCVTQDPHWEKDLKKCVEIAEDSLQLADTYLGCSENAVSSQQGLQMLSSAKLMLKGVVTKVKQAHTDPVEETLREEVVNIVDSLNSKLQHIIDNINKLKGT